MQTAIIDATGNDSRPRSVTDDRANRLAWRINDACAALSVSRSHIYDLAAAGKIRLIKIGGRTVVPDDEVQRIAREGA